MIHYDARVNEPPYYVQHRQGDPSMWFEPEIAHSAIVEAFAVICAGVDRATRVDSGAWVMSQVHVGHDVWIKEGAIVCPMSSLGGYSVIGRNARLDQGVLVHPYREIGEGARCGMGAVVIRDVPAYECWAGNPARKLYELCRHCRRRLDEEHVCASRTR